MKKLAQDVCRGLRTSASIYSHACTHVALLSITIWGYYQMRLWLLITDIFLCLIIFKHIFKEILCNYYRGTTQNKPGSEDNYSEIISYYLLAGKQIFFLCQNIKQMTICSSFIHTEEISSFYSFIDNHFPRT